MKEFYTYGPDESYPYQGGWTEVEAPDARTANRAFYTFHPGAEENLDCACIYSEESFREVLKERRGMGSCREKITVNICRETMDAEGNWIMEAIGYRREILQDG